MKTQADLIEALAAYRLARDTLHEAETTDAPSMVCNTARSRHAKACSALAETVDQLALQHSSAILGTPGDAPEDDPWKGRA